MNELIEKFLDQEYAITFEHVDEEVKKELVKTMEELLLGYSDLLDDNVFGDLRFDFKE